MAETLLVGAAGGFAFQAIGFPAGLVSGSMLAVAMAALFGRPMAITAPVARFCFIAVGILLGAVVTPETLRGMAAAPFSIAVLVVSTTCITVGCFYYLRLVHGWQPLAALLAASPGALAQAMLLASEYKSDMRAIVIVQSVRVLVLAVGLPGGLALLGFEAAPVARANLAVASPFIELSILLVTSVASAVLLQRIRFPGGWLFGAMVGSGFLHGGGFIHVSLPTWFASAAMIGTGAVAGARFANMSFRMLVGYVGAAFGSLAVAVVITCVFLVVVLQVVSVRVPDLVMSFSPGAQDTMMILALALHLDPVFVGAHHLARFLLVSMAIPITARFIARPDAPSEPQPPRRPPQVTPDD